MERFRKIVLIISILIFVSLSQATPSVETNGFEAAGTDNFLLFGDLTENNDEITEVYFEYKKKSESDWQETPIQQKDQLGERELDGTAGDNIIADGDFDEGSGYSHNESYIHDNKAIEPGERRFYRFESESTGLRLSANLRNDTQQEANENLENETHSGRSFDHPGNVEVEVEIIRDEDSGNVTIIMDGAERVGPPGSGVEDITPDIEPEDDVYFSSEVRDEGINLTRIDDRPRIPSTGEFSENIDVDQDEEYEFRARASNSEGSDSGNEISFVAEPPLEGSGTDGDPFLIKTCEDLQNIRVSLDSIYELVQDINCGVSSDWNEEDLTFTNEYLGNAYFEEFPIYYSPILEGSVNLEIEGYGAPNSNDYSIYPEEGLIQFDQPPEQLYDGVNVDDSILIDYSTENMPMGFEPIGSGSGEDPTFSGELRGNNYEIEGLYIMDTGRPNTALFRRTEGEALIKNVGLRNVEVIGDSRYTAPLVARPRDNTVITDVSATGEVYSRDGRGGGLLGLTDDTTIVEDSWADTDVSVQEDGRAGGLVAWMNTNSQVINSHAIGDVKTTRTDNVAGTGGLVGYVRGNNEYRITDSYASGDVTVITDPEETTGPVGGLTGYLLDGSVNNSYSTGNVSAEYHRYVGGLAGRSNENLTNVFATGNVEGDNRVGGLAGYTSGDSIKKSFATGNVEGEDQIGGLIGYSRANSLNKVAAFGDSEGESRIGGLVGRLRSPLEIGYSTGDVIGDEEVGGLLGYSSDSVEKAYASGSVEGVNDTGGLIGDNSGGDLMRSYWDTESSGQTAATGSDETDHNDTEGLSTSEMTGLSAETNMDSFNFDSNWTATENYPDIRNLATFTIEELTIEPQNPNFGDSVKAKAEIESRQEEAENIVFRIKADGEPISEEEGLEVEEGIFEADNLADVDKRDSSYQVIVEVEDGLGNKREASKDFYIPVLPPETPEERNPDNGEQNYFESDIGGVNLKTENLGHPQDIEDMEITFFGREQGESVWNEIEEDIADSGVSAKAEWNKEGEPNMYGFEPGKTYEWYVEVDDGKESVNNADDPFDFTVMDEDDLIGQTGADPTDGESGQTFDIILEDNELAGTDAEVQFRYVDGGIVDDWESPVTVSNGEGEASVNFEELELDEETGEWFIQVDNGNIEFDFQDYSEFRYEFVDSRPPVINTDPNDSPSPVNGDTGIELNPNLVVNIDNPDGTDMDVYFYEGEPGSNEIGGPVTIADGDNAVLSGEEHSLGEDAGETYDWSVRVEDVAFDEEVESDIFEFTTVEEPGISFETPDAGDKSDLAINEDLTVEITQADDEGVQVDYTVENGDTFTDTGTVSDTKSGSTFSSSFDLEADTEYNWTVEASFDDDGGNEISVDDDLTFDTAEAPRIIDFSPDDGEPGLENPELSVEFDDNDNPVTVEFYDWENDELLDTQTGVTSGEASFDTSSENGFGDEAGNSYFWYAVLEDEDKGTVQNSNMPGDNPWEFSTPGVLDADIDIERGDNHNMNPGSADVGSETLQISATNEEELNMESAEISIDGTVVETVSPVPHGQTVSVDITEDVVEDEEYSWSVEIIEDGSTIAEESGLEFSTHVVDAQWATGDPELTAGFNLYHSNSDDVFDFGEGSYEQVGSTSDEELTVAIEDLGYNSDDCFRVTAHNSAGESSDASPPLEDSAECVGGEIG